MRQGRPGSMGIGSWSKTESTPLGSLTRVSYILSETFHLITEFLISGKKVLFSSDRPNVVKIRMITLKATLRMRNDKFQILRYFEMTRDRQKHYRIISVHCVIYQVKSPV